MEDTKIDREQEKKRPQTKTAVMVWTISYKAAKMWVRLVPRNAPLFDFSCKQIARWTHDRCSAQIVLKKAIKTRVDQQLRVLKTEFDKMLNPEIKAFERLSADQKIARGKSDRFKGLCIELRRNENAAERKRAQQRRLAAELANYERVQTDAQTQLDNLEQNGGMMMDFEEFYTIMNSINGASGTAAAGPSREQERFAMRNPVDADGGEEEGVDDAFQTRIINMIMAGGRAKQEDDDDDVLVDVHVDYVPLGDGGTELGKFARNGGAILVDDIYDY